MTHPSRSGQKMSSITIYRLPCSLIGFIDEAGSPSSIWTSVARFEANKQPKGSQTKLLEK